MENDVSNLKYSIKSDFFQCDICQGYIIDATTISDCLHSFCKSCIILYIQSSASADFRCPTCNQEIKDGIKSDSLLQRLIYQFNPNLLKSELERRERFVNSNEYDEQESSSSALLTNDSILNVKLVFVDADKSQFQNVSKLKFSSLINEDRQFMSELSNELKKSNAYYQLKASTPIYVFDKIIRNKYSIGSNYVIEFSHQSRIINENENLIELFTSFNLKRTDLFEIIYKIRPNFEVLLEEHYNLIKFDLLTHKRISMSSSSSSLLSPPFNNNKNNNNSSSGNKSKKPTANKKRKSEVLDSLDTKQQALSVSKKLINKSLPLPQVNHSSSFLKPPAQSSSEQQHRNVNTDFLKVKFRKSPTSTTSVSSSSKSSPASKKTAESAANNTTNTNLNKSSKPAPAAEDEAKSKQEEEDTTNKENINKISSEEKTIIDQDESPKEVQDVVAEATISNNDSPTPPQPQQPPESSEPQDPPNHRDQIDFINSDAIINDTSDEEDQKLVIEQENPLDLRLESKLNDGSSAT